MGENTDHHDFYLPDLGEIDWGDDKNADWTDLDTNLIIKDQFSARPSAGTEGRWFLATDRLVIYYDDGAAWERVASVTVSDDGSAVSQLDEINFGSNLSVTDDGNNTVTVDGTAAGRPLYEAPNCHFPFTELTDGSSLRQRVRVGDGQTLTVYAWGVSVTDDTTPSGLTVQLVNPVGTTVGSANTAWAANASGIVSYENTSGTATFATLEVVNATGTDYVDPDGVGAQFGYDVA